MENESGRNQIDEEAIEVTRDGYVYRVVAVPKFIPLNDLDGGDLGSALVAGAYALAVRTFESRLPMKVGVLRRKAEHFGRSKVLHKEKMSRGPAVHARISDLADAVERGEFDG